MHTTSYISNYINGELCSKVDVKIKGVCSLDKGKSGFITFAKPLTKKEFLIKSKASAIIVSKNIDFNIDNAVIIKVDNPIKSFIDVLKLFNDDHHFSKSINKDNYILGDNVIIGKNVEIGDNTIIADNVKIGDNSFIGSSCFIGRCVDIQSGSVIDSELKVDTIKAAILSLFDENFRQISQEGLNPYDAGETSKNIVNKINELNKDQIKIKSFYDLSDQGL